MQNPIIIINIYRGVLFMKKNIEHLMNFLIYIKEHLLCFILVVLFFILSGIVLVHLPINNPTNIETQQILIFGVSLENWSIWYTVCGLIVTALWSMYQYAKNVSRKQQEKASIIAKSFSEKLTTKCSLICAVIRKSELYDFLQLKYKNYASFKTFTTDEIRLIYDDDDFIEKYKNKKENVDLNVIYYRILDSFTSFNKFSTLTANNKTYTVEEAKKLFDSEYSYLPFKFEILISDVLNELEYLCMELSSQAADSKYVYQSLHQVFLRTLRSLAVEVAMSNNNNYTDKYYTNTIHIYNYWTQLYISNSNKEKKKKEQINKILNPKIKTV